MATPLTPAGVKVQGNLKTIFCPGGVTSRTAPSVADITASDNLEVTNILYADSGRYTKETNTGEAPRRLGSEKVWQQAGQTNESFSGPMRYMVNPQGAAASDGKKAYEIMAEGTTGDLVMVYGVDTDADLAVGQFVQIIPVKTLAGNVVGDTTNEFDEFAVEQGVIVTAPGSTGLVQLVA